MKHTVKYKEIDGCKVVIGFDQLRRDPMASKNKLMDKMETHQATYELAKASEKYSVAGKKYVSLEKSFKKMGGVPENHKYAKDLREAKAGYQVATARFAQALEDLKPECEVFFEPRRNEVVVDEPTLDGLERKGKELNINEVLLLSGEIVENNIGTVYYEKLQPENIWLRGEIKELKVEVPEGAIREQELSKLEKVEIIAQNEKDRIAQLTDGQKLDEKNRALGQLAKQAANERSWLEIQGSSSEDALKQTGEKFKPLIQEIEAKYE